MMTDTASTVQQIFSRMPANFDPEAAKGLNSVIQFNLTGEGAAQYHAVIKDGTCEVNSGTHASPTMTLTMVAQDYADMVEGRLASPDTVQQFPARLPPPPRPIQHGRPP